MLTYLACFLAAASLDAAYVLFSRNVMRGHVWLAVLFSLLVSGLGMANCYWVIWSPETIPVILLGHGVGCWLAMKVVTERW